MKNLKILAKIINKSDCVFSAKGLLNHTFGAPNVKYVMSDMPVPFHILVKIGDKKAVIIHKNSADKPDLVDGEMAYGYLES